MEYFQTRILIIAVSLGAAFPIFAQEKAETQEEMVVLGTRGKARSVVDSPVPVDVIDSESFSALGGAADITDNLDALVPSYVAVPRTGDGSAFVRPTFLRGMSPDQTLVMINGKRRHRSALVQLFAPAAGDGSHGVDVAMIPSIALRQVEILRDGASAQYGSDAIAGVMNFALKDASEGSVVEGTFGKHFQGETNWKVAANTGFSLGGSGFANLSIDTDSNDGLSRTLQRPDAQRLIDAGISGVGSDAVFGDAPLVQSFGRPESSGTRFVFNMGWQMGSMDGYVFGNVAKTKGRFRFFYRQPWHGWLCDDNSDANDLDCESFHTNIENATNLDREKRAGFTPWLDGEQTDYSVVAGAKGEMGSTSYDFSVSMGANKLDYTLYNSINPDAPLSGGKAARDFDTGDFKQSEMNVNADFSQELSGTLSLAYGLEYRKEVFDQMAGDRNSYVGRGVSGLKGTSPQDAGKHDRTNYGAYGDLEYDLNPDTFLQASLRYEDFSDFGSTVNGKLAARYDLMPALALRGAYSTGFHAPTPGQANLRTTTTTFSGNNQIDTLHVPATSDLARQHGGVALKEETAKNISVGAAWQGGGRSLLTLDLYQVAVAGRIYRNKVEDVLANDGDLSFYTNALDVKHKGFDLVWASNLMDMVDLSLALNYNKIKVTKNRMIRGMQVVSDDTVEDIENNFPKIKFTLTGNTAVTDKWNVMTRARYIGSHYDERGNIAGTAAAGKSKKLDPVIYVDMEIGYSPMRDLQVILGGSNIFDKYPERLEADSGYANRMGVGLPYPRRTAANYDGGSWYLKAAYMF